MLEKVTKVSTLNLSDNQIEDISPLAKQTELKILRSSGTRSRT